MYTARNRSNNRITDLVVISLVLVSVTLLIAETFLPDHSIAFATLETAGHVLTLIFVVELSCAFWPCPTGTDSSASTGWTSSR